MDEDLRAIELDYQRFLRRFAVNDAVPTRWSANVNDVRTYEELVGGIADFLRSAEHKLLRTVLPAEDQRWMMGVPSAVRRAMESVGRTGLGTLIWVQLTYDDVYRFQDGFGQRKQDRSLRLVQRRVAEQVLGADATKELMDPVDEEDDYSGVGLMDRGILADVSLKITEELLRRGRFLLVIHNWWERDSLELERMGIPLPSKHWSQYKIILWDPLHHQDEQDLVPLGDPSTNSWLSIHRPAMEDRLAFVYNEAVDLADIVNGRSSSRGVTPQSVLDCLLFFQLYIFRYHPLFYFTRSIPRREVVELWVKCGVIDGSGSPSELDDQMLASTSTTCTTVVSANTAEAMLEELAHRRLLMLDPSQGGFYPAADMAAWLLTLVGSPAPPGYEDFKPIKLLISVGTDILGNVEQREYSQGMLLNENAIQALLSRDRGVPKSAKPTADIKLTCFPDDFFSRMDHLRFLLISRASISSLPSSLFGLPNLKILILESCELLESLFVPGAPPPPSTRALHRLRVLYLNSSSIRSFPEPAFSHMHSLEALHFRDCAKLNIVHSNLSFFRNMHTLRVLHLHACVQIESLPESLLIEARNLRSLDLSFCFKLQTLPPSLYCHPALEELNLHRCEALKEREIVFKTPMLKTIKLRYSPAIRRLCFSGCNRLEQVILYDLPNLEFLDLSSTAIRELSLETIGLPRLQTLVILGATKLRTFLWGELKHLPSNIILDQDTIEVSNYKSDKEQDGVHMHVHDGRFFRMLCHPENGSYSRLESSFFPQFHINISPSLKRAKREDNRNDLTRRAPFRYQRIQVLHPNILSKQSPLSRHIEIQGSHPSTTDMHGLLKNTLSLSINNQHSYTSLSELMPTGSVVKQCQIEECHGLKSVFHCSASSCQFQHLESLWASQLGTLLALAAEDGRRNFNWSQGFKNLKHIHLEFCPRLSYVFPPGAQQGLESLEILEISFCTDLKEVFASPSQEPDGAMPSSASYTPHFAPHLRIVHLLELPSLVSLCPEACKDWPALEKFKVRGCRRLKKLPFLFYSENTAVTTSSSSSPSRGRVMIDGEPAWWNRVFRGKDISTKHQFHSTGVDLPLPMPKK